MNITSNHPGRPESTAASRAEQLRQRRAQQTAQRSAQRSVQPSVQRSAGSEPSRPDRPVTVRNVTMRNATYATGTPVRSRVATTNPRRQYYVALNTPGTELRLPALPRLRFGPRLISGLVVLACLVGIFSMLFSSAFILGVPEVKGLQRLSQAEIEAALDIANFNAVEVNARDLSARLLERFDILEAASVSISLPNHVTVQVKERNPVFAWQNGGETLWADEKGFLFSPAGEPAQMLTINSADQPPYYVPPEQVAAIQEAEAAVTAAKDNGEDATTYEAALLALEAAKTPTGPRQIDLDLFAAAQQLVALMPEGSSLVYSQENGLGWQDAGGWDVYIGKDLTNFDQKFALYQHLIEQLNGKGITPAIISVEHLTAPYYRLER